MFGFSKGVYGELVGLRNGHNMLLLALLVSVGQIGCQTAGHGRPVEASLFETQNQWPAFGTYYEPVAEPNAGFYAENDDSDYPSAQQQPMVVDELEAFIPHEFENADKTDPENGVFEVAANIGQCTGLAVNDANNLVLFHRSGQVWDINTFTEDNRLNNLEPIPNATIAILDTATGKVLSEHGKNQFYLPHGLTIDSEGNHWLTDVGSHQVIKLNKDFKKVLEIGEKLVPGNDEKHFCKPTDVAVAKNGDFFVADGYCNSRVMKFDKTGKFLTSFGHPNSADPPTSGEFSVPHSLTLIEDLNLLCVADRENRRIQCFAAGLSEGANFHPRAFVPTGTFFTKAENIGRVYAIREKQHYLVGVINHDENEQVDSQVFIMNMNTGRANTFAKGIENAHALALSDSGDIYISQMNPNQIIKYSVPDQF